MSMFLRSKIQQPIETSNVVVVEPRISSIINGEAVTVRSTAINSPARLGLRIAEGDDVIAIWFGWENRGVSIAEQIGHLLPIEQLSKEDVLGFCQAIQVHPAHLVPLKSQPEFSLPAPLLELLIDMSKGRVPCSAEDINLAKIAVSMEAKRINSFLATQSSTEKETGRPDTLTKIFSTVLGNPILMGRLVQEFSVVHERHAADYPMAMRVRNVAYTAIRDTRKDLGHAQKRQERHLDLLLNDIEEDYGRLLSRDRVSNEELLFIADIKDELFEKSIDSGEATVDDILAILSKIDLADSPLEASYQYYNAVFGSAFLIEATSHQFLAELAEDIAHYLKVENKLAIFKQKYAGHMDTVPLIEDVKNLFEDERFKQGTLFRRLMDNRVILAMAYHQNQSNPSVIPR